MNPELWKEDKISGEYYGDWRVAVDSVLDLEKEAIWIIL